MDHHFSWDSSGLSGPKFQALSNALRLRTGGQLEPTFAPIDEDAGENPGANANDARSDAADLISDFSVHAQIKKRFLNRLAELAANEKRAGAVACTAIRELGDQAVVWIARNEGFEERDVRFFDELASMLGRKGGVRRVMGLDQKLWQGMVTYYKSRLKGLYISQLRAAFKSWGSNGKGSKSKAVSPDDETDDASFGALQELYDLCFSGQNPDQEAPAYHERLVLKSYEIWRKKEVKDLLLHKSTQNSKNSENLWLQICFLGRFRAAYEAFRHAAAQLLSFEEIAIICIPTKQKKYPPPTPALSLDDTLKILRGHVNPETFKEILPKKYKGNLAKARKISTISKGCRYSFMLSKLSCFTCWHFLLAYGEVATRGCHGQLAHGWTIPEHAAPSKEKLERLVQAVKSTQRKVKGELMERFRDHQRKAVKQSLVGSVPTKIPDTEDTLRDQLAMEYRKNERRTWQHSMDMDRFDSWAQTLSLPAPTQPENPVTETQPIPTSGIRDACERETDRKYSDCGRDWFCSDWCQKQRMTLHLFKCSGGRSLTSADYLYLDCLQDLIPSAPEVRTDFWFRRLPSAADQSKLLGLYQGLRMINEQDGTAFPETLHQWQVEGSLVKNIIKSFHTIPGGSRGGHFPWFMTKQSYFPSLRNPRTIRPKTSHEVSAQQSRLFSNLRIGTNL